MTHERARGACGLPACVAGELEGSFIAPIRLEALRDDPLAGAASRLMESKSVPLFMFASLSTLITGLIMAFGWIGFGPLWIKMGLAGIFVSLVLGFGYFKPQIEKLDAAVSSDRVSLRLLVDGHLEEAYLGSRRGIDVVGRLLSSRRDLFFAGIHVFF